MLPKQSNINRSNRREKFFEEEKLGASIEQNHSKRIARKNILLFIFFLIILFLSIMFFDVVQKNVLLEENFSYYQQQSTETIDTLKKEIVSLKNFVEEITSEKNILSSNLEQLSIDYAFLKQSSEELNNDYTILKEEVDSTIQKIIDYEKEIQSSMDWFSVNSKLSGKQKNILLNLKSNCKREDIDSCEINIACFSLINNEFQNFSYLDDEQTSLSSDKMQSIDQLVANKGGDCEDFALLFKAEYNSLIEECLMKEKEIDLFSWTIGKEKYWLNNASTWFIEDAKKVFLEKNYFYPVIICGNIFDLQSQKINGHCVIAFTKKSIYSKEDLSELFGAPIIEPQTGRYLGRINIDGINMVDYLESDSFINVVITDNDFFLYVNNHWNNYSDFKEQLEQKKELLEELN